MVTHGLNEELGRYSGRNSMTECILCGEELKVLSMFYGSVPLTRIIHG